MSGMIHAVERNVSHFDFTDKGGFNAGMGMCLSLSELSELAPGEQCLQTTRLSAFDKGLWEMQNDDEQGGPPYAENRVVVIDAVDLVLSQVTVLDLYLVNGEIVLGKSEQPVRRLTQAEGWMKPDGVDDCRKKAADLEVGVEKVVLGYFMKHDGGLAGEKLRVRRDAKKLEKTAERETLKDPNSMSPEELERFYGKYRFRSL
jgi:hypothetical protein